MYLKLCPVKYDEAEKLEKEMGPGFTALVFLMSRDKAIIEGCHEGQRNPIGTNYLRAIVNNSGITGIYGPLCNMYLSISFRINWKSMLSEY